MRAARVYRNALYAGILKEETDGTFSFEYDTEYWVNNNNSAISLTLPKINQSYKSKYLFPFFFNMLTEGVNRKIQLRHLQISEGDNFGLLLATSSRDSIGAVTLEEIL